jgi:branched-chain amino acid transport system ATP-binding protein
MMLDVTDLHAAYGGIKALRGVSLTVREGEMVALVGSNGAGKSTLLNSISGIIKPAAGSISFDNAELSGRPAWSIARDGLIQVPEGRQIVPDMSVRDNLLSGTSALRQRAPTFALVDVFDLFPILREREQQFAGSLSGGQQQMLAIGRALMGAPRLLLLDEPSLGLAPIIINQVFAALKQINRAGLTILLVEQNARKAFELSDRAYVIDQGAIVLEGASSELAQEASVIAHYLGNKH